MKAMLMAIMKFLGDSVELMIQADQNLYVSNIKVINEEFKAL